MAFMAHQKHGAEMTEPDDLQSQDMKETVAANSTVKPRRKTKVVDVLNLIGVIVLIALLLFNMFYPRDGDLFGDEIPTWDRRA
jgi:hypothetical protein